MALTLQSALAGGRYPDLRGHGYPELSVGGHSFPVLGGGGGGGGRDSQELPMDLSRRRSPSPDVSITTGRNVLLDRAMGPPPGPPEPLDDSAPHDLRLGRPSHSIIPFHKLRKHAQKGPRARLKRQRLEEAVSLLREREAADGRRSCEEETAGVREETAVRAETGEQPPAPPTPQLMQQMLMMQQTDSVAYPSLFYLQYCAMVQSLQLQQALRRQQATKLPPPPFPAPALAAVRRPDSASPASSPGGTPPTTPSTPGTPSTPDEPPQRRRAPRTLTGKHVRQGQGASPETLRTLRRVLLEKARLRELGLLPPPKPKPKGRRKK